MNRSEATQLLATIAVLDNRRVDDATILAWHGILGDLDLDSCLRAVEQHFAASTDYLMPAHVRSGAIAIRNTRREQADRIARSQERLAIGAGPDRERVAAHIASIADALSRHTRKHAPESPADQRRQRAIDRAKAERARRDREPAARVGSYASYSFTPVPVEQCQRPLCGGSFTPGPDGVSAHVAVFGHRPIASAPIEESA